MHVPPIKWLLVKGLPRERKALGKVAAEYARIRVVEADQSRIDAHLPGSPEDIRLGAP